MIDPSMIASKLSDGYQIYKKRKDNKYSDEIPVTKDGSNNVES